MLHPLDSHSLSWKIEWEPEPSPVFLAVWLSSCHVSSVSHTVLAGKALMMGVVSLLPSAAQFVLI